MPSLRVAPFESDVSHRLNHLHHPESPIASSMAPTRFDAWSSRGGRPEWTLWEHPHLLGRRIVC